MDGRALRPTRPAVAILVATRNREPLFVSRALPSILSQSVRPAAVVIVNDGAPFSFETEIALERARMPSLFVLRNQRRGGLPGAWNTGLGLLAARGFDGYVALLDDDDTWDGDHLEVNLDAARQHDATLVVSGLRLSIDGTPVERALPTELSPTSFLVGNPGWQGSNTFVRLDAMLAVRGFRDGLASLNDRDLAVRLLRQPGVRPALTGRWTATWHHRRSGTLSSPRSAAKLLGLQWFWRIYAGDLGRHADAFFARAERLFGFRSAEILAPPDPAPPHVHPFGDLHGHAAEDQL